MEQLPSGTKILVETKNSVYEIETIVGSQVLITGGSFKESDCIRFPMPTKAVFTGSTLEEGMKMNFFCEGFFIVTSPIKNVTINPVSGREINLHLNQKD